MQTTLSLFDISCILSPPSNLPQHQHRFSITRQHFYQHPIDLTRFVNITLERKLGFLGMLQYIGKRYWYRYRSFFLQKGICNIQEIPGQLLTLLSQRLESTLRKQHKGLSCPSLWYRATYNWGGFLYTVLNNLLRSFLGLGLVYPPIPSMTEQDFPTCSSLLSQSLTDEETAYQQQLPSRFVHLSQLLYQQNILSPKRHLVFACFHAPQALSLTTQQRLFATFPLAQPNAAQLFEQSGYQQLLESEPNRFTARNSYLAWLLLGRGSPSLSVMQAQNPEKLARIKREIHRCKINSKQIIFKYLTAHLSITPMPIGFESDIRRLRERLLLYLQGKDQSLADDIQQLLRSSPSSTCLAQELYAKLFTKHNTFAEALQCTPTSTLRRYQTFHRVLQRIPATFMHPSPNICVG